MISKNATIGENIKFGNNVTVYANAVIEDNCIISDNTQIGYPTNSSFIKSNSHDLNITSHKTYIGKNSIIRTGNTIYEGVSIGESADISHNTIIRFGSKIGKKCYILPNSVIHENVIAGNNFTLCGIICNNAIIGNDVKIMGKLIHTYMALKSVEKAPIIENNVFIGFDTIVVGGITIGENNRINAGQLIVKSIKKNTKPQQW